MWEVVLGIRYVVCPQLATGLNWSDIEWWVKSVAVASCTVADKPLK